MWKSADESWTQRCRSRPSAAPIHPSAPQTTRTDPALSCSRGQTSSARCLPSEGECGALLAAACDALHRRQLAASPALSPSAPDPTVSSAAGFAAAPASLRCARNPQQCGHLQQQARLAYPSLFLVPPLEQPPRLLFFPSLPLQQRQLRSHGKQPLIQHEQQPAGLHQRAHAPQQLSPANQQLSVSNW